MSAGREVGSRRTCVACRHEDERDALVRLVRSPEGEVVVDYRGKLPGRGAWLHATSSCVSVIEGQRGRLQRALDGEIVDAAILEQMRARVREATFDGLSMGAASGALVGGHDLLSAALREGRVVAVILANDASDRTVDALRRIAPEDVAFTVVPLGRDELGARIGRGARAAVGVLPSRANTHLLRQLQRLRALG